MTTARPEPPSLGWRRFLLSPDQSLVDAGRSGELVVAKLRVALVGLIVLLSTPALLVASPGPQPWIALGASGLALLVAIVILGLAQRGEPIAALGFITGVGDVTVITLAHIAFLVQDLPVAAANSRNLFGFYLLAILATCLRWDVRISLATGALAIVEYAGIVLWAVAAAHGLPSDPDYGRIDLAQQVGRLVLLVAATTVAFAIVAQTARLRFSSTHDALTGLYNRAYFEERFGQEIARTRRYDRPLSVALLDLDHFKAVNDTYGHAAGDDALRAVADLLRDRLRQTDLVARWGGEEFALVFPETTPREARAKLQALRDGLTERHDPAETGLRAPLTFSAGIAAVGTDGENARDLLIAADDRLLAGKRAGRDRIIGPG